MPITTDAQNQILLEVAQARNDIASLNVALSQFEQAVRANDETSIAAEAGALQASAGNVSARVIRITNVRGNMTHSGGLPAIGG